MFSFPKTYRLLKRQHYNYVARKGLKFSGRWICLDVLPNGQAHCKIGITVTKRYGDAVARNRFKRLVREAFRLSVANFSTIFALANSYDLIVRPRTQAQQANMYDIQHEMVQLLQQAINR